MISLAENTLANSGAQCGCHSGGGGDAALAHLLEDIMARLDEAAVLSWTAQPSSYNSCLPGTLAIHNQVPHPFPTIDDAEMDTRVTELRSSMSPTDVMLVHDRFIRVPSTRLAHQRLYLPCILFPVKKLAEKRTEIGEEKCYRARAAPLYAGPIATMDVSTRTLRLVARLQRPFCALLLQQQSHGGYKRVAAEHEIVVPGLERHVSSAKDVQVEVVEIL